MDYGMLPPEINSGRIYSGPGSAPMMAAASAWNNLAAELSSAASSYESAVTGLTSEEWLGPASASMTAAAQPYVTWMSTTAAQAQQAATQAQAAAAAYEAAFAMTVPPAVIAANRAQLAVLVATNILGQNTPAIMATEAHYGEMWAQDAAAMYGYAGSSAAASKVTPFTLPAQTTHPGGLAGQVAAVTHAAGTAAGSTHAQVAQLMSAMPSALQGLSSPLASTSSASSGLAALSGTLKALGLGGSSATSGILGFMNSAPALAGLSGATTASAYIPSTLIPNMVGYFAGTGENAAGGIIGPYGPGLGALLAPGGPLGNLGALGGGTAGASAGTAAVSAGMGQASTVGALSVPAGWSAATPAGTGSATLAGTGWTAAPESTPVATMPAGMPALASAGRGPVGFGAPRYGFKPTVMPRSVVG